MSRLLFSTIIILILVSVISPIAVYIYISEIYERKIDHLYRVILSNAGLIANKAVNKIYNIILYISELNNTISKTVNSTELARILAEYVMKYKLLSHANDAHSLFSHAYLTVSTVRSEKPDDRGLQIIEKILWDYTAISNGLTYLLGEIESYYIHNASINKRIHDKLKTYIDNSEEMLSLTREFDKVYRYLLGLDIPVNELEEYYNSIHRVAVSTGDV